MTTADALIASDRAIRRAAAAVGPALAAVEPYVEPSLARAVQAEQNLYDRIDVEFGLLTPAEAGRRLGSRSGAARNLAATARKRGRVAAISRGSHRYYPGFQFDDAGALPVMAELLTLASETERTETGVVQWLCSPTTYLDNPADVGAARRPVDLLRSDPARVLAAAAAAWRVEW